MNHLSRGPRPCPLEPRWTFSLDLNLSLHLNLNRFFPRVGQAIGGPELPRGFGTPFLGRHGSALAWGGSKIP